MSCKLYGKTSNLLVKNLMSMEHFKICILKLNVQEDIYILVPNIVHHQGRRRVSTAHSHYQALKQMNCKFRCTEVHLRLNFILFILVQWKKKRKWIEVMGRKSVTIATMFMTDSSCPLHKYG